MEYFDRNVKRKKVKTTDNTQLPATPDYLTAEQMYELMSESNTKVLKVRLSHLKKLTELGFNVVNVTDNNVRDIITTLRALNKKDSYISLIISTLKRINPNIAKINFNIKRNKNYKQAESTNRFLTNYIGSQNVLSNVVSELLNVKEVVERYKTLGEGIVDCYVIIILMYFIKNMLVYDVEQLFLSDLISIYKTNENKYKKFIFYKTHLFNKILFGLITLIRSRQIKHEEYNLYFPKGVWENNEFPIDKITPLLSANTNASGRSLKQLYIMINKNLPNLPYGFKMYKNLSLNDEEIKINEKYIPIINYKSQNQTNTTTNINNEDVGMEENTNVIDDDDVAMTNIYQTPIGQAVNEMMENLQSGSMPNN